MKDFLSNPPNSLSVVNVAGWSSTKNKKYGVAIFNFDPSTTFFGGDEDVTSNMVKHGLTLEIGDIVFILEECSGWYRGFCPKERSKKGIFPANYVALKPFRTIDDSVTASSSSSVSSDNSIQPHEDPVSLEVVSSLREWHRIWKDVLYLKGDTESFDRITKMIYDLIDWRRQILSCNLSQQHIKDLRVKITKQIDVGNRILGMDFIPRTESGLPADPEMMSPISLYDLHVKSLPEANAASSSNAMTNLDVQKGCIRSSCHGSNNASRRCSFTSKFVCLHVKDVSLTLPNPEDAFELHFSIYDSSRSSFFSEKFISSIHNNMPMSANDTSSPSDVFVKSNVSTVFTDIGISSISNGDLYLLIQVFRFGKMVMQEGKSKLSSALPLAASFTAVSSSTSFNGQHNGHNSSSSNSTSTTSSTYSGPKYKRPHGCAIIHLSDILKSEDLEKEFNVKLSSCSNDNDFYQLQEHLIRKQTNKFSLMQSSSLTVSLRSLTGTDVNQVSQDYPLLFKNITCLTGKKGFPDVVLPDDVRNDLYLTLESGEFEKGGKSIPKNVEASVSLLTSEGKAITETICPGCGVSAVTTFLSNIMYHSNSPKWNELIKILIPLEVFDLGAHIKIEYRHCSAKEGNKEKKLIGFSFIPLSDDVGTIIGDGSHELHVYRTTDLNNTKNKGYDPTSYLRLPYGPKDTRSGLLPTTSSATGYSRNAKEVVHVKSLLCSTKLTQNGDLLSLLKWRTSPDTVEEALYKVLRLNGEEIVKFLQDILDALFSMFSTHDGNSTHYTGIVFRGLIHIFSLLEDSKYEHFKPVLDTYIQGHFAAALVYKGLLSCVKQCADHVKDVDKQERIQGCFKSLGWIFKFIVQSRILYSRATGDASDSKEMFKQNLFAVFASFNRMLSYSNEPSLLQSQITFVENFPTTYTQLMRVLSPLDVARLIRLVIACLCPTIDGSSSGMTKAKLACIRTTMEMEPLMKDPDARKELLEVFCRHLREHINSHQELETCSELVSMMLEFVHHERVALMDIPMIGSGHSISQVIEILVMNIFESLLRVIIELATSTTSNSNPSSLYHKFIVSLVSLLRLMDDHHFNELMSSKTRREKRDILFQVFHVFKKSFSQDLLPRDWSAVHFVFNHVILCSMQELSMTLITEFLDNSESTGTAVGFFDEQLWNSYFILSVSFLTQDCLQLESFSCRKREGILDKYADMRVLMGFQILSLWEKLGDLKVHFIPSMVAPFLEVTLVPEKELRKATLPIFYDMIDAEYKSSGSFKSVECNLIDKLDLLVGEESKGDDGFRQLFMTM